MEFLLPPCSPIVFDDNSSDDNSSMDAPITTDTVYPIVLELFHRLSNICSCIPEHDIPLNNDYKEVVKSSLEIVRMDGGVPNDQFDRLVKYYIVRPADFFAYFISNLYRWYGCDTVMSADSGQIYVHCVDDGMVV